MPAIRIPARLFFLVVLCTPLVGLGQDTSGRIPDYPVPYTLPTVDGIKAICTRVRSYCSQTSPQQIQDRRTGDPITDLSEPNQYAVVSPGFSSEWTYTHGVVISACDYLYEVTGDQAYLDYNTRFYDFLCDHLPYFRRNNEVYGRRACGWRRIFYMRALDHCGSIGAALIKTYQRHKDQRYRALIDQVADYISHKQFRLDDGTLARQRPQAASLWADDLYMSVPFLARMGELTGDNAYLDDAVRQVLQQADRLFIPEKGLFDHGWNVTSADYDPRFYWGRANGWTVMAMAELLSVLPPDHPGRDQVLHLYRSLLRSAAELQDGTGFWHNMLDKTDTFLETSCTAMFTYGIAKGINEGWISHVYGPVAQTGWNAVATRVLDSGAVDGTCEGTTFAHDNTYYYHRGRSIYATHGYGPVLFAGAEMIKLLQNDKITIQKARPDSINSTYQYVPREAP